MLIDNVRIKMIAGSGGKGAVSFRSNEGKSFGGPDGGNGGNGGSIYLVGTSDLSALSQFQHKKQVKAENGVDGKRKNLFGKNAPDLFVKIPYGTEILSNDGQKIGEVVDQSSKILLVKGGKGGRGNNEFKSATNQTPRFAEKGEPGEEKEIVFELKLIAQVGLIGLPNAGKSSLLSALTNARPKIGNYPFTTLEPNLGMMDDVIIADVPGLIEGASSGRGLGTRFLKHVEKTQLLAHCIDASTEAAISNYETVRQEFAKYDERLLDKPEIIILTKTDQVDKDDLREKLDQLRIIGRRVFAVSILDDISVKKLRQSLISMLK